jgi:hypothetical protein
MQVSSHFIIGWIGTTEPAVFATTIISGGGEASPTPWPSSVLAAGSCTVVILHRAILSDDALLVGQHGRPVRSR